MSKQEEKKDNSHDELIDNLLNDCNSLNVLAGYIGLVPEMEQLCAHLISIEGRILEAVDILKGE